MKIDLVRCLMGTQPSKYYRSDLLRKEVGISVGDSSQEMFCFLEENLAVKPQKKSLQMDHLPHPTLNYLME